ncbi:MAG: hypothetical protein EPN79_10735 [Burkholderiaceae bacterium]|nr:MAG: hypothetical protein EPN79_10735 [Burkholderiaceae bacterium]TBR76837.1 MAG: hypothetical protein EPN64_06340 [Burkholderiaceae bacterium]
MTTKIERERLLLGQDEKANAIIECLCSRGWIRGSILKNVATKEYRPHVAVVRVEYDSEYQQYWVSGQYDSEGNNVLAGSIACIKGSLDPANIQEAVDDFLVKAEHSIGQSFAVRFQAGPKDDAGEAGITVGLVPPEAPGDAP